MSKTTKIIAALGIVAGLGVAAIPAASYATQSTTGDVQVDVNVEAAIAMTIEGNNDDGTSYDDGTTSYASVDNASPSSVAGSTIDTHEVPSTLVAGTSSSYATLLPYSVVQGSHESGGNGFASTITVYTNNASGFTLNVIDRDATTALTHTNGTDTIPTGADAVQAGTAKWNFDTTVATGGTTEALTAAAMPASTDSATTIDTYSSNTSGGRTTYVDYNVATDADQVTGVYSDTIVYTATTR